MQSEELNALRDKYWKETKEWNSKLSASALEAEKLSAQHRYLIQIFTFYESNILLREKLDQLQVDSNSQRQKLEEV